MKNWSEKYIAVFEKPFQSVDKQLVDEIRQKVSSLQSDTPLVSIVIIAHNEANRILSCVWSLAENLHSYPIEIIGVDNCSTDMTSDVFKTLGIKTFFEDKPGPGFARQCGLDKAKGQFHVCIDSDTMYPPYYIQYMIKPLVDKKAVATFALWSFLPSQQNPAFQLKVYETLRDLHLKIQSRKRPELSVRGMAFAFDTNLAKQIGFRTDIRRGEDGSMLLELKKYGEIKFITSSQARVLTSSGTLNVDGSLFSSFGKRFTKYIGNFSNYFTKQSKYKDDESNLL